MKSGERVINSRSRSLRWRKAREDLRRTLNILAIYMDRIQNGALVSTKKNLITREKLPESALIACDYVCRNIRLWRYAEPLLSGAYEQRRP